MGRHIWERVLLGAAAATTLAAGLAGPAVAQRIDDRQGVPQTFLIQLDTAPTVKTFRLSRADGSAAAKAAARRQKGDVRQAQSEVIAELPADADPIYRTHALIAGVGVRAEAGDQEELAAIPGVRAVYPVAPKRAENSYAMPFQGAPAAWQSTGFLGLGQRIAVIDTGVDYTHAGFGGPGTTLAYQQAHAQESQPANPSLFPSAKVVGGIDLVGDSYDSDPSSENYQPTPHPDPNPLDCNGHGSHVAGSAAGYGVAANGATYSGPYDNSTDLDAMKVGPGMAPKAGIYAIRVLGCDGSSDVVAEGIDRAVDPNGDGDPSDHVDVINLSVGADFGSVQDGDSVAANAAAALGVSVVAAAGNAGDHTDISGSPGDASRVLSVANSVDAESKIDGAKVKIDGSPQTFGVTKSVRYDWSTKPDLSGPLVRAPAGNRDACKPYPAHTFDGKVVLVEWHDAAPECSSIARGDNLSAAGAKGFIFASDAETFSAGINGSDQIPGVLMVASGSDALRDALTDGKTVTVQGTQANAVTQSFPEDDDKVAISSSRGIHATGNVKPDVAAVGTSVFSVAVGSGNDGISETGTSMASPMVAGLAALVREAHPSWSPLQVKADIMNTARHDLSVGGSADPSSDRYGPNRVGAGRIDAGDAVANRVLAYDADQGAVSVSFGPVEAADAVSLSRQVTVENLSASAVTYDTSYEAINSVPGAEISVSPATVNVAAGAMATVTVSLKIDDPAELTKAVDPTVGRMGASGFPRETLAEAYGRLLLTPQGSGATLRVPVYASPRPASAMTQPDSLQFERAGVTAGGTRQTAELTLSGSGVGAQGKNGVGSGSTDDDIESLAAGFELQAKSGESPQCSASIQTNCWRLPEEQDADIKLVGFTSDAPLVEDPTQAMGYFALAVRAPWSIPSDKVEFWVDIDVNGDTKPDLFLYSSRHEEDDLFVAKLIDPSEPEDEQVIDEQPINGRLGDLDTALYDSDVIVMPISLDLLSDYGVNSRNPRISYGVEGYSGYSPQPIDTIGVDAASGDLQRPMSVNLFEPGIVVTEGGEGPLLQDQPGARLKVTENIESYRDDAGPGLMMVHFHNRVGAKAQVVDLRDAPGDPTLKAKVQSRHRPIRGWYRDPVTVKFSCVTHGSPLTKACPASRRLARDGRKQKVSATILAQDGGAATVRVSLNIDRTRPKIRVKGIRRGGTYSRLPKGRCLARDRTSGVFKCRIVRSRHGRMVKYKAIAVDRAGNRTVARLRIKLRG